MAGRERAEPGRQTHQWFQQECENPVLCDEVASGQAELTNPLQISLKYAGLLRRPEPYVFHMYGTLETEELKVMAVPSSVIWAAPCSSSAPLVHSCWVGAVGRESSWAEAANIAGRLLSSPEERPWPCS